MNDRLLCSDIQVAVGQVWMVKDRVHEYPAWVTGFVRDRVEIRAVCAPNVKATPTLALRHLFNNTHGGYMLLQEAAC